MQVTRATSGSEEKEFWITLRGREKEFVVVHVLSNEPVQWSMNGHILNLAPKKIRK